MSREALTFKSERQRILRRVGRQATRFSKEPDPELYAMLAVLWDERHPLDKKLQNHLSRMVSAQIVLVTDVAGNPEYEISWQAARHVSIEDTWAYEKVDDPSKLTLLQRAALSDVAFLQTAQLQ